jgi:hypothetical protein
MVVSKVSHTRLAVCLRNLFTFYSAPSCITVGKNLDWRRVNIPRYNYKYRKIMYVGGKGWEGLGRYEI